MECLLIKLVVLFGEENGGREATENCSKLSMEGCARWRKMIAIRLLPLKIPKIPVKLLWSRKRTFPIAHLMTSRLVDVRSEIFRRIYF